jgi:hypothetical protein
MTGIVEPDDTVVVDGRRVPVYRFGCAWKGTHYTNCCNCMAAAFYVAAGPKSCGVKGPDGAVATWSFSTGLPKIMVRSSPKGTPRPVSVIKVFQQTMAAATQFWDADGNRIDEGLMGGPHAVHSLGLGRRISVRTKDPAALRALRIGDLACHPTHAFLVGDVRYGIWLADGAGKKTPDLLCDQSSFVRSDAGTLFAPSPKGITKTAGEAPPTEADCDWIVANEAAFEGRVQTFLAATALTVDGRARPVARIEPVGLRVFGANGRKLTVRSAPRGNPAALEAGWGITRPWQTFRKPVGWARFYGPAAG